MRDYKQQSQAQRYQIEILKKAGKNQKEIAKLLDVTESTISRELTRNQCKKDIVRNRRKSKRIIVKNKPQKP